MTTDPAARDEVKRYGKNTVWQKLDVIDVNCLKDESEVPKVDVND